MRSSLVQLCRNLVSTATKQKQLPGKTIYLTHVKWITGRDQLEYYFKRYGDIEHVTMFFDPETGLHRGYASLTFSTKEAACKAIEERPHVIDGDRIDVEPYVPNMRFARRRVENVEI